jgi:hypothetical protein
VFRAELVLSPEGPMLAILKIFWTKNLRNKFAILTQNTPSYALKVILTVVLQENQIKID